MEIPAQNFIIEMKYFPPEAMAMIGFIESVI